MEEKTVEIKGIRLFGLKIYIESRGGVKDEYNVQRFKDFLKHEIGNKVQCSSYYRQKAKQFLGTG